MTALASRVAGARLVIIICVLLIPIILLSFLRIQNHREAIERTDKELAGVAVSDALVRSLVGIASGEIQASGLRQNLASLEAPASRIGAEKHISTLSLAYSSPVMDKTYMVDLTAETLHEVGVHSNLIMDQEPVSYTHLTLPTNREV